MSLMQQNSAVFPLGSQPGHQRLFGVYPAIVTDNRDPQNSLRVQVSIPLFDDELRSQTEIWARFAMPMAGHRRGTFFLPEVNDEVLVSFEAGNPSRPIIIGSLWNGSDTPPVRFDVQNQMEVAYATKAIVSRNGIRFEMIDTNGTETCRLETPAGHKIEICDKPGHAITITTEGGCSITLGSDGVLNINSTKKMSLNGESIEINAGSTKINSGLATFSGTIKCDTLIANNVNGKNYTPGAGNIW
jgi:uncharacterized protein involved in type VI secretion and phage assembly